jgi:type I restriction enzyme S subunit
MSDGWATVRAGAIARIEIGGTPAREQPAFWAKQDSGHPWASIADLSREAVEDTKEYISDLGARSSNAKLVPAGTPIMSFKLTIGRTAIAARDLYTNEAIAAFFVDESRVDRRFLYHILPDSARSVVTDVAIKGATLNKKSLASLPLLLPPLEEQRRITEVLDTLDDQIQISEQAIAKMRAMGKALLADLMSHGISRSGRLRDPQANPKQFWHSPIGVIPSEWETIRLEEASHSLITYGIVQPGPYCESGVPYVQTRDLRSAVLVEAELDRTAPAIAAMYRRSAIADGDVLCGIRASVGDIIRVPQELDGANISRGIARISPSSEFSSDFLFWLMKSPIVQHQIMRETKGSTYLELTLPALRNLTVVKPTRGEQDAIASVLDNHASQEAAVFGERQKLGLLKQGIMSDLLTGRCRVPTRATS